MTWWFGFPACQFPPRPQRLRWACRRDRGPVPRCGAATLPLVRIAVCGRTFGRLLGLRLDGTNRTPETPSATVTARLPAKSERRNDPRESVCSMSSSRSREMRIATVRRSKNGRNMGLASAQNEKSRGRFASFRSNRAYSAGGVPSNTTASSQSNSRSRSNRARGRAQQRMEKENGRGSSP